MNWLDKALHVIAIKVLKRTTKRLFAEANLSSFLAQHDWALVWSVDDCKDGHTGFSIIAPKMFDPNASRDGVHVPIGASLLLSVAHLINSEGEDFAKEIISRAGQASEVADETQPPSHLN